MSFLDDIGNTLRKTVLPAITNLPQVRGAATLFPVVDRAVSSPQFQQNPIVRTIANTPMSRFIDPAAANFYRQNPQYDPTPTIGKYVGGQIYNPIKTGLTTLANPRQGSLNRASGAFSVLGGIYGATPGGFATNLETGGLTGVTRSVRTGQPFASSTKASLSSPASLATQGLGIENPALSLGIDVLAGNPKSVASSLKNVKTIGKSVLTRNIKDISPNAFNIHPDDEKLLNDYMSRIFAGKKLNPGEAKDLQTMTEHYLGSKYAVATNKQIAKAFQYVLGSRRGGIVGKPPTLNYFAGQGDARVPQTFKTEKFPVGTEGEAGLANRQHDLGLGTRTVRSFDEMKAKAEELGLEPQKLIRDIENGRITDSEVIALGNQITTSSKRIAALTEHLKTNPTDVTAIAQLQAEESLINDAIRKRIKGGTEAGRSVAAFKVIANQTMDPVYWLDKAKRQLGDKPITPEVNTAIDDFITHNDRLGLATYVSKLGESSGIEKATAVWKAGLLTGFRTHEANIVSNAAMAGLETVKDIPATAFDIVRSKMTGTPRAKTFSLGQATSQVPGAIQGGKKALSVIRTGVDPDQIAKAENMKPLRFGNTVLGKAAQKYTNAVFGALGAEDKVFREAAFTRSVHEQAALKGINEGLTAGEVQKLIENPPEDILKVAESDAKYATFNNDNSISDAFRAFKGKLKTGLGKAAVDFVVPFVRTPTNVVNAMIDYTPIGIVREVAVKVLTKDRVSDKQLAEAFGRSTTGAGILWLGYILAQKGLITGSRPPAGSDESAQWDLERKTPNSIFINGKWRSLGRISPFGNLIMIGAQAQESKGDPSAITFGALKTTTDQSFLKGLGSGLQAVNDPTRFGSTFINSTISGYVPTLASDLARGTDTTRREPKGIKEAFLNRIPGGNTLVPSKLSPLGEDTPQQGGFAGSLFDPFNSSTPNADPLVKEFSRVGYNLNYTGKTIGGQSLTRDQERQYQRLAGRYIRQLVEPIVTDDGYRELTIDQQRDLIDRAVTAAKTQAREELKQQLPTLQSSAGKAYAAEETTAPTFANPNRIAVGDQKKPTTSPVIQKFQEKQIKDRVAATGKIGETADAYFYPTDAGVKRVLKDRPLTPPVLTGMTELDKKAIATYKGEVTAKANDIVTLYQIGKLTAPEAERQLRDLKSRAASPTKKSAKGGGAKNRRLLGTTAGKLKTLNRANTRPLTLPKPKRIAPRTLSKPRTLAPRRTQGNAAVLADRASVDALIRRYAAR